MHRTSLTLIFNLTQPDLTPGDGTNETESAEMDDDEQSFTNIFNNPEIQEQSIYSGASINRGQLLCLILAFILKYNISGSGLKDLLDFLNIVAPGCAPTSKYYFDKSFFNLAKQFEIHHYCKICSQYIGKLFTPCCSDGNVDERVNTNEGYYFLVMPLRQQLKELFKNTTFYKFLNDNKTNMGMGDIYSGSMYTSKLKTFVDTLDNISLSFNIDGASVFKSSNYSIWPIICTVNELPSTIRGKYAILHSLWFGSKPEMPTLLRPFVKELQDLFTEGFSWHDNTGHKHNTKVAPGVCICDAPARDLPSRRSARAMVQEMKQFNGRYGCGFCLHMGEIVPKGKGFTRVYPHSTEYPQLRTHDQTTNQASAAIQSDTDVNGVKGPSQLLLLPNFDIIKHFVPEYMHSVCLGVTKQFVRIWCDSKNSALPFYLQPKVIQQIDSSLLTIHPPHEVKRCPRSLSERHFWKASEWRAFLLFYSPILLKTVLFCLYVAEVEISPKQDYFSLATLFAEHMSAHTPFTYMHILLFYALLLCTHSSTVPPSGRHNIPPLLERLCMVPSDYHKT
ncbi:hypothetical protein N1851_032640 [Merluccius polli]|uniref:Transposase domain-containing protein n=1 Tax=Merluccius polli TaxID=89951 RepID=A0AA47M2Q4_MERPO|nr:hypothetical protein N1851_032640 [Merluccius polli]